jgi:glutamine synthetase
MIARNVSLSTKSPVAARQAKRVQIVLSAAQRAEYIWYDGNEGTPEKGLIFNEMRSKTKCIPEPITSMNAEDFPDWSYDGSSTGQAEGDDSDVVIKPVFVCPDPIRGGTDVLVMCETFCSDGKTPHPTNDRAKLRAVLENKVCQDADALYGFEQEYTMLDGKTKQIYGWPEGGYPAPQGPFYCGVGPESVYGRELAEAHMDACIKAGLTISGINAEVMPGQWEFQIGPAGPLDMPDHVMIGRWLLYRLGEEFGITSTLDPKPMAGDWNGTGAHTNFSTAAMRVPGGMDAINEACEKLSKKHPEHIAAYGTGNERRLTGAHETCDMDTFKIGVADRGCSIRIPLPVSLKGYGYLEDRRPSANVNPYVVSRMLLQTCLLD